MKQVRAVAGRIISNVEKVIFGKHEEVQLAVLGLLCCLLYTSPSPRD